MYNVKEVLTKEPAAVKATAISLLAVLVITGVADLSGEATAAIGLFLELLLGLFYVRASVTPNVRVEEREQAAASQAYSDIKANDWGDA